MSTRLNTGGRVTTMAALIASTVVGVALTTTHSASAAVPPAFVQQVSTHQVNKASVALTPNANLGSGNRLVVQVGVWSGSAATAKTVTDAAGDVFTELVHFAAADRTELSVWTAPIGAGGGSKPAVTVTATATADIGAVVAEYSGLSTAAAAGSLDVSAQATGQTTAAATVASGAVTTTASNEMALGFYLDSGFGTALTPGTGFTARANVSPTSDMQLLVEDQTATAGSAVNASVRTGANTYWLMTTVVFQSSSPTPPGAPTNVVATPANASATVTWTAPASGNSPITSYTVTPFAGSSALSPVTVSGTPPATTATVSGLTNGTSYRFSVTAANTNGAGMASALSDPVTPGTNAAGTWAPLQTLPIVPLAAHLLYNGKLVAWDGWQQPQPSVTWDPTAATPTFATVNAPDSVFCDGGATLPDGRLLVVGGYGGLSTGQIGIVDTTIYDPATNSWSRVANMKNPRWYPTLTELSDGRYLALSGNSTNASTWADTPEVYTPSTNTWTSLTGVNTSTVHEVEYPFTYELPSGQLFVIGPEEDNSHLLDVNAQSWVSTGASGLFNGSSVMYRPGKILYSGGAALIDTPSVAQKSTAVIDLTATTPTWRATAPMNNARIYHTLTMLADGTVLSVGGANTSDQNVITTGVLPTEIWDPSTETWTPSAPIAAARNYHSTAILLPDGRVWVGGGGHPTGMQDPGQYSSQLYSPSYLSRGARPSITSASASATYGSSISVTTPDAASITGVNLVSMGADTHQIDMNQHFIPLTYTAGSGTLSVQAPATAGIAPPGNYMLFILKNGVPSVASIVHVGPTTAQTVPAAPTAVTAAAGDARATVSWTAPANGNSPISSYTVTPYVGSVAQTATTVSGSPAPTSATVTGLTNGTSYTFTVTATNAVGAGPASSPSGAVVPSPAPAIGYIQSVGNHGSGSSLAVTPSAAVTSGNRLVVEVGVWSGSSAKASAVSDSAGNTYTKLTSFTAADNTEMSVWTAPITAGGGARPVITATATATADIGVTAAEYSGLSTASGAGVVDVQSHAVGTTTAAATVSSSATPATAANGELALGFYADSGFNSVLSSGSGWTSRANVSPNGDMDMLIEDATFAAAATPAATVATGASTPWLAATIVFKSGASVPATVPAAPSGVVAAAGNASARVSWTAPANGGSAITTYTVTPYVASVAQAPTTVSGSVTAATITGLTNGTGYNFSVTATNSVGTGPASSLSSTVVPTAAARPAFVQQVSARAANKATLAVTPTSALTSGNRLVVEVGVWNSAKATATTVTDSAGDTYTELLHFTGSDGTELSVWSAPVTSGAGTKPTITAKASAAADVGIGAVEYSGLATSSPVDVSAQATGTTTSARSVSSGSTAATTADGLAIGFYLDSGFGTALSPDPGYNSRVNVSPFSDIDLLVEDAVVTTGAAPAPSITTGANTVWLAATVVFRAG